LTFYHPKKVAPPLIRVEENPVKLSTKEIKRSTVLRLFQEDAKLLRLKVPKFFSPKIVFC
jgi:hypothetical protein